FEAGFMLGVVRALGTPSILPTPPEPALSYYRQQRAQYHPREVAERFAANVASTAERAAARTLARYHLLTGHMAGLGFMREYIDSLVARAGPGERTRRRARAGLRVRYWQCSLLGANRLDDDLPPVAQRQEWELWLRQLGLPGSASLVG